MNRTKVSAAAGHEPAASPSATTQPSSDFASQPHLFGWQSLSGSVPAHATSWVIDGITFPPETEFRGRYKGYVYYAKVEDGALIFNGQPFLSPSAAAAAITRYPIDGWIFWDCKLPGTSLWVNLYAYKTA